MNMNQVMETKNAESTEVAAQKETESRHEVHKVCQTPTKISKARIHYYRCRAEDESQGL